MGLCVDKVVFTMPRAKPWTIKRTSLLGHGTGSGIPGWGGERGVWP